MIDGFSNLSWKSLGFWDYAGGDVVEFKIIDLRMIAVWGKGKSLVW